MLDQIRDLPGTILDRSSYHRDFAAEFGRLSGVLWKLERVQTFREPGDPSWEAFMSNDWEAALALNEDERAGVKHDMATHRAQGVENRRLRIVEHPLSPYLQWEMHFFRILAEEGFAVRVLDAERVRHREETRPLPEVVVLGEQVLYHVLQHDDGTPRGAARIDDPTVITSATRDIADLYAIGESLLPYFEREVSSLPSPNG